MSENKMQFDPTKIELAEELDEGIPASASKSKKKTTAKVKVKVATSNHFTLNQTEKEKTDSTSTAFSFDPEAAKESNVGFSFEQPAEEAPIVNKTPDIDETPVVDEASVVEETPVVDETPVVEEASVVEEAPVVEEASIVEEAAFIEPEIVAESVSVEEPIAETELINIFSNASAETASEGTVDLSALNTDTIDESLDAVDTTDSDSAVDETISDQTEDTETLVAAGEAPADIAEKTTADETTSDTAEPPAKKDGLMLRILKFFIPWKDDPKKELFRKIVFLVALVVFIGAFSYLAVYLNDRLTYEAAIQHAEELINKEDTTVGTDQIMNKYRDLYNDNNDFCGWITIPNTNVNGAVYQTLNNSYYIDHNGQKKKSIYGAYFADYKCNIAASGSSQNITLYGHHMRDQTMFAQIRKYKDISFYKENPTLTFDTLYTSSTYKVFAAFITNADPADDNGYFFDFAVQGFINQEDFLAWIEQVRRRSLINTAVDIVEGDDILTLSTCTYELGSSKDMRFVVMARKVRDGETETVNVADVSQNATPLYPAAWYKRFGSKKPVFEDGIYTWGETSSVQQEIIEEVIIPQTSSEASSVPQSSSTIPSIPSFTNPHYSSSVPPTSSGWYTPEIVNPWDEEAESFVNPWDDTSATPTSSQVVNSNPQYYF